MLKFHNKVCDQLRGGRQAGRRRSSGGAPDRDLALPVDGPARLRRAHHRARDRREDSRTTAASSIASRKRPTCRSSSPPPRTGSATAWCARSTATTASSRPVGVAPATLDLLFQFTGLSGGIIGDLAPNPPPAPLPLPCCRATGSSTGAASTKVGVAESGRRAAQRIAQDRSVRRAAAAHAAGRRRQPAVPQSEARRDAGAAVRTGRRQRR